MTEREQILTLLADWIAQRPGLDPRNYDASGYRSDSRRIAQQGRDAEELLRAVRNLPGITGSDLRKAFRAFSGRLSLVERPGGLALDYCTGQYWPTEYRAAACAVLRSALWDYWRIHASLIAGSDNARDSILAAAKRTVSAGVFRRWFKEA
jgi:hypothetical protein